MPGSRPVMARVAMPMLMARFWNKWRTPMGKAGSPRPRLPNACAFQPEAIIWSYGWHEHLLISTDRR
ncbi:MAG: hypothetical protein FD153_1072 [Rhodospirillaceae bacterium]|nr:MAG: hypothetical protein FD153_1072 [Rhodospirillaceae bacterium]